MSYGKCLYYDSKHKCFCVYHTDHWKIENKTRNAFYTDPHKIILSWHLNILNFDILAKFQLKKVPTRITPNVVKIVIQC